MMKLLGFISCFFVICLKQLSNAVPADSKISTKTVIGHSLGLEHSNLREAVMYPWYRENGGQDFDVNVDDILRAQLTYGSRSTNPEKITTPKPTAITATLAPSFTLPKPPQCINQFKAILLHKSSQKTYVVNDEFAYILGEELGMQKGPFNASELFRGVDRVDAMYYNKQGEIVVFSGRNYSIFEDIKGRRLSQGTIQQKYGVRDNVEIIDAAFIWNGDGRTYLFAGENYYQFNESRKSMDFDYPKSIVKNWLGLPKRVDSVFIWRNGITYFFKDNLYYRFNNNTKEVEKDYPKPINPAWTKCTVGNLQQGVISGSVAIYASTAIITVMFAVVKFIAL